ncbi:Scr1 family TA system antitoxin-like transcriptional regulator [Streptomyces boncukensis]|uniref:Helix-turn-helix domain-containing protein n=1 Tax=Streptomyces boncukensis TaxID=2711219 RepID=A0A6G4X0C3_9ACTN|nr:Scr1 family TA system antitoxin-like transcriptional regulator [Streptomyces boncukensis]NGO70838.1 helix-turn-helix domain-containing protein [Streptomyces boncukensis]
MAARKPPTERQRRLGAELRKMRESVGLSLTDAARVHRSDKGTLSNTESGRYGVGADRVRVWAASYRCPDPAYVDALVEMARERRFAGPGWWDEYADVPGIALDLAELEHYAVRLRTIQMTHLPGLLQHEDYVRAVFEEEVPALAADSFRQRLDFRLQRSRVLDRPRSLPCTFIIHEAALRMRFGGPVVMKRQLEHLLEQSERENVDIRVLPFEAGGFPASAGSTLYAYGPVRQLDTVHTDTNVGSSFLHAETHLANFRAVLDRWEELSLEPHASRDFIREAAQQQ